MVLSWVFKKFDLRFGVRGVEGDRWEDGLRDFYIVRKGRMWVDMKMRR